MLVADPAATRLGSAPAGETGEGRPCHAAAVGWAVRVLPGGVPAERPGYGTCEQGLGAGGQRGEGGWGLDAERWSPDGDHRGAVGVHPVHGCGGCLGAGPLLVQDPYELSGAHRELGDRETKHFGRGFLMVERGDKLAA